MIKVTNSGSFQHVREFGLRIKNRQQFKVLSQYGPLGVAALAQATPVDKNITANSWYYEIVDRPGYFAIHWYNSHMEGAGRISIAAILQYGHATRTGGYVQGRDYINPAIQPIFDQMVTDMWKEVTK